jgi:PPOX class probable F420-dependent enzyme
MGSADLMIAYGLRLPYEKFCLLPKPLCFRLFGTIETVPYAYGQAVAPAPETEADGFFAEQWPPMLTRAHRRFLESRRVAYLATVDAGAVPHVVPVCFVVDDGGVYITIDEKPKRVSGRALKRLRNIAENPNVALVADRYNDRNWSRLGWVMVRGRAEVLDAGPEHAAAQRRLRARYPQYAAMALEAQPVIAIRIERVASWGDLRVDG